MCAKIYKLSYTFVKILKNQFKQGTKLRLVTNFRYLPLTEKDFSIILTVTAAYSDTDKKYIRYFSFSFKICLPRFLKLFTESKEIFSIRAISSFDFP